MLRRTFPLTIVMLSAWSQSNDCEPGQVSEAYILWWRDRKPGAGSSGQGRPWFLQMETRNCFENWEEEKNRDEHPPYFLACKAPRSCVNREQVECQMEPGKYLRET